MAARLTSVCAAPSTRSCVCVAADLDKKRLTLRTYAPGDYGGATTIELSYEKLLIARLHTAGFTVYLLDPAQVSCELV